MRYRVRFVVLAFASTFATTTQALFWQSASSQIRATTPTVTPVGTAECSGISGSSPANTRPIQKATLEPREGGYSLRFTEIHQDGQQSESQLELNNQLQVQSARTLGSQDGEWKSVVFRGTPVKIQPTGAFSISMMVTTRSTCTFSGTLQFVGNTQAQLFSGSSAQANNPATPATSSNTISQQEQREYPEPKEPVTETKVSNDGKLRIKLTYDKAEQCMKVGQHIKLEVTTRDPDSSTGFGYYYVRGCLKRDRETGKAIIQTVNLDDDKAIEGIIDFHTGGNSCCGISLIYDNDEDKSQFKSFYVISHVWSTHGYKLENLDGDGALEFVSSDGRFNERFSSGAKSGLPLQIWQFRKWSMLDSTKGFSDALRKDSQKWLQSAQGEKSEKAGYLAAFVADKVLLGEALDAWKVVAFENIDGNKEQFAEDLNKFLLQQGYNYDFSSTAADLYKAGRDELKKLEFTKGMKLWSIASALNYEVAGSLFAEDITGLALLASAANEIKQAMATFAPRLYARWGSKLENVTASSNRRRLGTEEEKPSNIQNNQSGNNSSENNSITPPGAGLRSPNSPVSPELPPNINRAALSNASVQGQLRSLGESQKGSTVNEEIRKILGNPSDFHPPFTPDATVTHSQTTGETLFIRFSGGKADPKGSYMMRLEDVQGLTPAQIRDKFAITKDNLMTEMSAVKVRGGAEVYSGSANKHPEWGNGGGTQYFLPGGRNDIVETIPIKTW